MNGMRMLLAKIAAVSCFTALALSANAQSVSPEMIEQFKSLPKAQQEVLARQYGVEIPSSGSTSGSPDTRLAEPTAALPQAEKPVSRQAEGRTESPLKRFGVSLFDATVSTFAPTDNAQVPADYRLGIGDELVVQLFGKENELLRLQVGRDGGINFPRLGPVSVAGLSFDQAQNLIQTRVNEQLIGVDSIVSMGRLRAMNIFLAGEVAVPGAYSVSALTTITQALYQGGGVTDIGSLRNVQVKRSGKLVATLDLYDLLLKGDISDDLRLQSGDVVFVPPYAALVSMIGEVKRPAVYEVLPGETLGQMVDMAGGYKSSAFAGELVVIKKRAPGELPEALNIRAKDSDQLSMRMSNGDIVRVLPLGDTVDNLVTLEGALARPGIYGWKPGLRVSDLIGDFRRDLLPDADLGYSLIVREKNQRLDIEVLQFSLVEALTQKGSAADPLLSARDKVLVFSWDGITSLNDDLSGVDLEPNANSRERLLAPVIAKLEAQSSAQAPSRVASIRGAVKVPGAYPLGDGYTLQNLIDAASGADDSAYMESFEVRRMTKNALGENEVQLVTVPRAEAVAFELQPRDAVNVKRTVDWNPDASVTVGGEVKYPGTYFLQRGETIKDVLARAGGFTPQAFVEGVVFTRQSVAEIETQQARQFAEELRRQYAASLMTKESQGAADYASLGAIADDLQAFTGQGRLVIDIQQALAGDPGNNLLLQDGDRINVPTLSNTVTVLGEVRRQGSHTYNERLRLDDYLALGAGSTSRADVENIYVVKANGSVVRPEVSWTQFTQTNPTLDPGDTIIVPINSNYRDSIPFWRDITQIIYQGTVTIAAAGLL